MCAGTTTEVQRWGVYSQRRSCVFLQVTNVWYKLQTYGSRNLHQYLDKWKGYKFEALCAEFNLSTTQRSPPQNYEVDYDAEYECFANGGFENGKGVEVGNTTVKCNVTWVLSWFKHASRTPIFVETPIWYQNPDFVEEDCENITMSIPKLFFLGDQTHPVADSYWMCGNEVLVNTLPLRWVGLCALVRMKLPITLMYEGVKSMIGIDENRTRVHRSLGDYGLNEGVYLNLIGQPRGIPNEFKALHEVTAGFESILPWITINKNVEWINYVYYNQQRLVNFTVEGFMALGDQLHETSRMALQNRQALDWILADKGGVCHMFGNQCCTYIPMNTAPRGTFSAIMVRLRKLKEEMKENAGKDSWSWKSLEEIFGNWGALAVKTGLTLLTVLVVIFLLVCCVLPIIRKWVLGTVYRWMTDVGKHQKA
ncbi:syncytin-B-like [Girardinichthys multiradiatus]|uniref:syncytin-B-like n=1 Tax=Girardinichthys multiradiatus TaxID=208333 RepID=UPI001FAC723F|nr:syncytin-B-like [Girardinichthys multiradiatus]